MAADVPRAPRWADYLEYAIFRVAWSLFAQLPHRVALALGAAIGDLLYLCDRPHRRIALFNLRLAFPDLSDAERTAILRRSCRNLGRVGAECTHLASLTPESLRDYVDVEEPDRWQAALAAAEERGAVILTGHLGNFELLAYAHGLLGHPITLVHKSMRNPLVDGAVTDLRARVGTVSLAKKSAAKAALRALHAHHIVAIPADQNQTRRYGVFVDFFGVQAATTPGPARLAMLSRSPIFPVFLVRDGESARHRIVVLPEIELVRSGDRDADILVNTQRCTAMVEEMLRRYPDQWIWFHRRWNTRPLGEPRLYPAA